MRSYITASSQFVALLPILHSSLGKISKAVWKLASQVHITMRSFFAHAQCGLFTLRQKKGQQHTTFFARTASPSSMEETPFTQGVSKLVLFLVVVVAVHLPSMGKGVLDTYQKYIQSRSCMHEYNIHSIHLQYSQQLKFNWNKNDWQVQSGMHVHVCMRA